MHATSKRLTILHVATINKPITSQMGYGPIETVIYNMDKGLHALGHRSIVACSSDSTGTGEKFETVSQGHGDYWRGCNPEGQAQVDLYLSRVLARVQMGDIDIIHMHEWFEHVYTGSFNPPRALKSGGMGKPCEQRPCAGRGNRSVFGRLGPENRFQKWRMPLHPPIFSALGLGSGMSSRWAGQTRPLSQREGLFLHASFG